MLLLLALLILIALNAFFVAAEFALVRSKSSRLQAIVDSEPTGFRSTSKIRGAKRAIAQLDDINMYLSSCQVGITMASIAIGFIGEPAFSQLLEPLVGEIAGHALSIVLVFTITYIIVTSLHIVIGEQVPKIYAIYHPERIAILIASPLHIFTKVLKPAIWALSGISTGLLRLLGVKITDSVHEVASMEDVKAMIVSASDVGDLDNEAADMLSGVFRLHEQQARSVMTPSPKITAVQTDTSLRDAAQQSIDAGHTRLIVMEDDNVVGMVHLSAIIRAMLNESVSTIQPLVKPVPLVPETKPLDDLLRFLQQEHSSIAVVLGEYGDVQGVVSIEDIVEEAVGEILDENDENEEPLVTVVVDGWLTAGETSLDDLADIGIHVPVHSESFHSIGGYVFSELGRLPVVGDEIVANGYVLRVQEMDERRISKIKISHRPDVDLAADDKTNS